MASTSDREPGLPERVIAYQALMDAIVPESQYGRGEREDADRVAFLSEAVRDPATVFTRRDAEPDEQA